MIPRRNELLPGPWALTVPFALLALVLFALPLVIVPWAVDSFVLGKETLLLACASILAALCVGAACFGVRLRLPLVPLVGFMALALVWTALSIFWSHAPTLAIEESIRLGGVLLFVFCLQSLAGGVRRRLLTLAKVLLLSTFVLSLWVIAQDFRAAFAPQTLSVKAVLGDWRDALSVVGLGNTSHIGDMLALGCLGWLTAFPIVRSRTARILTVVALWTHSAALIAVWSVHSNVSVLIGSAILAWALRPYVMPRAKRLGRLALVIVAGWVFVVLFYTVDHPVNPHGSAVWGPQLVAYEKQNGIASPPGGYHGGIFSQAFASPRWTSGLATRLAIWYTGLEIVRQHPWLGVGAGNFTYEYPATVSELVRADPELAPYGGSWTNAAHNELIQFWAELGIVGPFLLIILVGASVKATLDRLKLYPPPGNAFLLAGGLAMLAAQCAQAQMNFPLQLPVSGTLFLTLLLVPAMLPVRGREAEDLLMPVERGYGPVTLGITLKNMHYPIDVSLRMDDELPAGARGAVAALALALGLGGAWFALAPLRADIAYRPMREAKLAAEAGRGNWTAVALRAAAPLAIWPGHVDCRSALQDVLLRTEDYAGVLRETPLVLRKLNATEVYLRHAIALEALGRPDEAHADWDEIFRRRPDYAETYPRQYAEWAARHPAAVK